MADEKLEQKPTASPPATVGETVTVALKMPNGLILQTFDMVDAPEQTKDGPRTVKMARRTGEEHCLNGSALDVARMKLTGEAPHMVVGGYGITSGVPKGLWDRWLRDNADSDLVRNGLIYAVGNEQAARARANEQREVLSGMEPIDPANPRAVGRDFVRVQPGTTAPQ